MTRDEAIEKLEEMADESKALGHIDEFCGLEQAIKVVKQIDEPTWHTDNPMESKEYLVWIGDLDFPDLACWHGSYWDTEGVVAWKEIEPYKENSEFPN